MKGEPDDEQMRQPQQLEQDARFLGGVSLLFSSPNQQQLQLLLEQKQHQIRQEGGGGGQGEGVGEGEQSYVDVSAPAAAAAADAGGGGRELHQPQQQQHHLLQRKQHQLRQELRQDRGGEGGGRDGAEGEVELLTCSLTVQQHYRDTIVTVQKRGDVKKMSVEEFSAFAAADVVQHI
ncbi:hypothetical protein VYU27_003861 [Nannochloropsis oceanica]